MNSTLWISCVRQLEAELSEQLLNTWIRPLQADEQDSNLLLYAPNRFVLDWVNDHYLHRIRELVSLYSDDTHPKQVQLAIGSRGAASAVVHQTETITPPAPARNVSHNLNRDFTFDSFVEGKSNQLAKAAALQVANNSGLAYNPLLIYGGVGLGKHI